MNEIEEAIWRAIPRIAIRIQNELIIAAPVDTGRLRNSIRVTSDGMTLTISIVDYAFYVEFGCFFKDTIPIKTKKGNKKLKDLKIGELIWTGKEYKKLIQKEKMEIGYPIKKIIMKTKNKKLEITEDHPIWTSKGWKKAHKLKVRDRIKKIW